MSTADLPAGSKIQKRAVEADNVDAYKVEVVAEDIHDSLRLTSFGEAREVARTDREIVIEGRAPDFRFLVPYLTHHMSQLARGLLRIGGGTGVLLFSALRSASNSSAYDQ